MTGQKNRFSTTEKLWDLDDKQLKTPVHDAMVLWLMDIKHIKQLIDFPSELVEEYDGKSFKFNIKDWKIDSEVPVMSSKTFIAGYLDLLIELRYWCNDDSALNYTTRGRYITHKIEVKPYIDSFGAVLRQIKSYQKFSPSGDFYLFTFDDRFDAQFKSQGITMLHPPISKDEMLNLFELR